MFLTIFLIALYIFSDLTYVLFPVAFIWRLQMPLHNRIGLILVMCMSLFTMAMSILKTANMVIAFKANFSSVDAQYDASLHLLYGLLEQHFVIIMGCIPSLRSLIKQNLPSFKIFSSSWSGLTSLMKGSKSNPSQLSDTNNTFGTYHELEAMNSRDPGRFG